MLETSKGASPPPPVRLWLSSPKQLSKQQQQQQPQLRCSNSTGQSRATTTITGYVVRCRRHSYWVFARPAIKIYKPILIIISKLSKTNRKQFPAAANEAANEAGVRACQRVSGPLVANKGKFTKWENTPWGQRWTCTLHNCIKIDEGSGSDCGTGRGRLQAQLSLNFNFNFSSNRSQSHSYSFSFTRLCIYVGIILVRKSPQDPSENSHTWTWPWDRVDYSNGNCYGSSSDNINIISN